MENRLIIKELCKKQGVTIKELAEKVGISANMLSIANSGNKGLSIKTLIKVADALGVSVGELFSDYRTAPNGQFDLKGALWLNGQLTIINSIDDLKQFVDNLSEQ